MGRLELPLPELGRGTQFLEASADEMLAKIRANVPAQYRDSIKVMAFKRRGSSGLAIEFDDAAETYVHAAVENP